MTFWIHLAVVLGSLWLYYGLLVRVFDEPAVRVASRWFPAERWSPGEQAAVVEIAVAAAAQLAMVMLLTGALGLHLDAGTTAGEVAVAVPLGIGQAGAAMFLCMCVFALFQAVGWIGGEQSGTSSSLVRSGWVRSFVKARRAHGHVVAPAVTACYVVTEEVLFRGVVLEVLEPAGETVAILGSTILFVLAQTPGMPSVRHGLFPMATAALLGVCNAYLVLEGVGLVATSVAHLTLFFVVSGAARPAPSTLERSRA